VPREAEEERGGYKVVSNLNSLFFKRLAKLDRCVDSVVLSQIIAPEGRPDNRSRAH